MKVVFLLDNNEYVEVAPEKLQIRQVSEGVAALGTEVIVPLKKEDGSPDVDDNGQQKTQTGFRPFINYSVVLSLPKPVEADPGEPTVQIPGNSTPAKKSKATSVKAKRKAN